MGRPLGVSTICVHLLDGLPQGGVQPVVLFQLGRSITQQDRRLTKQNTGNPFRRTYGILYAVLGIRFGAAVKGRKSVFELIVRPRQVSIAQYPFRRRNNFVSLCGTDALNSTFAKRVGEMSFAEHLVNAAFEGCQQALIVLGKPSPKDFDDVVELIPARVGNDMKDPAHTVARLPV